MKELIITSSNENQRLDKFLKRHFKAASSSFLYKMLRKKNIVLNDKKATGTEILKANDSVKVYFSDETYLKMIGSSNELDKYKKVNFDHLDIVYEDDDIIALNKPKGILSQQSKSDDISLNEELLAYLIDSKYLDENKYQNYHPSVLNRLDFNTTGLVFAAKTLKGAQFLADTFKNRNSEKKYHCIVAGKCDLSGEYIAFHRKDETTNLVSIIDNDKEGYKKIITGIKPIKVTDKYSLLEIDLITGKTHQIRAHLAKLGFPIVGDYKYGNNIINSKAKTLGITSQLLHSYSMKMEGYDEIIAKEPKEFEDFINGNF